MHTSTDHWEAKNRLHVQFSEDQSRVRSSYAAHDFAIVRHIILNILSLNPTRKDSIETKRLLAATSGIFRAQLLEFMT